MNDSNYSVILRNLSSDYYHGHIGFDEYRMQRKIILDKIDEELNRASSVDSRFGEDESNLNKRTFHGIS